MECCLHQGAVHEGWYVSHGAYLSEKFVPKLYFWVANRLSRGDVASDLCVPTFNGNIFKHHSDSGAAEVQQLDILELCFCDSDEVIVNSRSKDKNSARERNRSCVMIALNVRCIRGSRANVL